MVETYQRRSTLAHLGLALRARKMPSYSVTLSEGPRRMMLNLRGRGNEFTDALYRVTRMHLPKANRVESGENDFHLLWLGPNEYLLTGPEEKKMECAQRLREEFGTIHYALVDLSESRTIMELSGEKARDILMRGMSIDLHPREFSAGQCAQSSLGKVNVLLHQRSIEPLSYDLYVGNSFADYAWRWLEKIAEPFGCRVKL